jgi:hypothetical protein
MKRKVKQIENYCQDKKIDLIQVVFENLSSTFYIEWNDELSKFLEFAKKSNCQTLFQNRFEVQFQHYKSRVEDANILDRDFLEDAEEVLKNLKKFSGRIIQLSLLATVNGINIIYLEYSEDAEEFFELSEKLEKIIELGKNKGMSESTLRYHERKDLMKPFAIELATHEDYYRTLISQDEQFALMDKILGDRPYQIEGYNVEKRQISKTALRFDIINLAKAHFKIHVEPELEKEFIKKITEWKKTKTPKIKMASMLGITMNRLNYYYYKT